MNSSGTIRQMNAKGIGVGIDTKNQAIGLGTQAIQIPYSRLKVR